MKDKLEKIKEALEFYSNNELEEDKIQIAFEGRTNATEALSLVEDLQEESQWQPIATAPKDKLIMVWFGKYLGLDIASFEEDNNGKYWRSTRGGQHPTHWMLLPQPPKNEEQNNEV